MAFRPISLRQSSRQDRAQAKREWNAQRRGVEWRRWYGLAVWSGVNGARVRQLSKQPVCERCLIEGRIEPATVVNHRKPHKGDWALFIDPANHESVCKPHHDRDIQSEERRSST